MAHGQISSWFGETFGPQSSKIINLDVQIPFHCDLCTRKSSCVTRAARDADKTRINLASSTWTTLKLRSSSFRTVFGLVACSFALALTLAMSYAIDLAMNQWPPNVNTRFAFTCTFRSSSDVDLHTSRGVATCGCHGHGH